MKLKPQLLQPCLLGSFPNVKHIDLSRCPPLKAGQITALQVLPSLAALRALLLDEGQMLAVAAEIAQLRGLTFLDVSGCVLSQSLEHLFTVRRIVRLELVKQALPSLHMPTTLRSASCRNLPRYGSDACPSHSTCPSHAPPASTQWEASTCKFFLKVAAVPGRVSFMVEWGDVCTNDWTYSMCGCLADPSR